LIFFVYIFIFCFTDITNADLTKDDVDYTNAIITEENFSFNKTPLNKLWRGVINTTTCLGEVPTEVYDISKKNNTFVGLTLGFTKGLVLAVFRGLSGIFDAVTCIIPPYNRPLMEPEYVFDKWDGVFVYDD
jgi:putative exosortase-associated protein (TIGR04073 family)